jgi:AsmA protein
VSPSSGIQGVADFDGAISSNGQQAKASGTLKADKLKLAAKGAPSRRTVALKYAIDHNLKTGAGTLTQGDVAIGKALARLTGSYQTQGQTTTLNMKLNANDMPVDEIEAVLPALGVVLPSGSKLQGGGLSADCRPTWPSLGPHSGPERMLDLHGVAGGGTSAKSNAEQERPYLAASCLYGCFSKPLPVVFKPRWMS